MIKRRINVRKRITSHQFQDMNNEYANKVKMRKMSKSRKNKDYYLISGGG